MDVLVVGAGPAGWAVAAACARLGLETELVDPDPHRPWRATYGAWRDEVDTATLTAAVAAGGSAVAVGTTHHDLGWQYVVFDNDRLRKHLATPDVRVRTGTVTAGSPELGRAAVVVDATGPGRAVLGGRRREPAAEQTAVGVVVPRERAEALCPRGSVLLMDWRAGHGGPGWPTFLYGVPMGPDSVLLEETSLAARPGFPIPTLRDRLARRLRAHGIDVAGGREEIVRFPLDTPVPRRRAGRIVPFGAAAPLVHPATGFSVATSLRTAPRVATAIATGLTATPEQAAQRAWEVLWNPRARAVHGLRLAGLRALLRMEPTRVPQFFDVFFDLPGRHRWAYLTGREDLAGVAATMAQLYARSPGWLRKALIVGGCDPRRVSTR